MQFDFSSYTVEQRTQANNDLRSYLKQTALKIPYTEIPCPTVRSAEVDRVCEEFFDVFGQYPDSTNLYYLSNYMLLEDIKDPDRSKRQNKDAFLSPRQWRSRYSRELPMEGKVINFVRTRNTHNIAMKKMRYEYDQR